MQSTTIECPSCACDIVCKLIPDVHDVFDDTIDVPLSCPLCGEELINEPPTPPISDSWLIV
jgi:hypothetical protein